MANQRMEMGLALFVVSMILAGANAQSNTDCTQVIISMSPCLSYIQGNSTTPASGCCTQLETVVRSQPQCLCQVLNGGSSLGININQTQALALPKACNVQTPGASQCKSSGGSPASSPGAAPGTPSTVPSGRGSDAVPSTNNGSSDATSIKLAAPVLFCLLFVASYASTF
ncbi:OLC1v1019998C1 [Oldenlandia corymbosa var. corymbosa]|uniref:OLC1v1019998C1 n=1 Tax=Oldenlandia corymbosa var. corymbosa TaxID=529605 RepID=A0AAV1EFS0_OLDCO|nr:OLC1v1019998C1 [Oldenlandia corymbosa var. corymbosa]